MAEYIIHSFEAGRRGKPDELDAGIAHLIGAYFLELDKYARFDLRVHGSWFQELNSPCIGISGEVSARLLELPELHTDIERIILDHYNHVHQTTLESEDILLSLDLKPQAIVLAANGHAGDSGNPIAVAYRNAPYHLPWERYLAVGIRDLIDQIYQDGGAVPRGTQLRSGIEKIEGLRADGKIGVDAIYEGSNLQKIDCITIAVEHEEVSLSALRTNLVGVVRGYLDIQQECHEKSLGNPEIVVNAAGPWCHGGWKVDEGSREAKSYRDGFGTYGVMEDSFSGEDPTKPSGTGTFLARYIAVQIVAQNLADFARVALRYTIGREDVGLNITTNGTGRVSQEVLERWTRAELPLNIGTAIERFDLRNPALYGAIVKSSDFFQNPEFPWNRGDFTPFQMPRQ